MKLYFLRARFRIIPCHPGICPSGVRTNGTSTQGRHGLQQFTFAHQGDYDQSAQAQRRLQKVQKKEEK